MINVRQQRLPRFESSRAESQVPRVNALACPTRSQAACKLPNRQNQIEHETVGRIDKEPNDNRRIALVLRWIFENRYRQLQWKSASPAPEA